MPSQDYEIRIRGRVGEALRIAFADLAITTKPVETVLFGELRDQAALHGLLARIQELGLEVVELRQLPSPEAGATLDGPSAT